MGLQFTWDQKKAAANARKHQVSFEEAAIACADPESLTVADPDHSQSGERLVLIGLHGQGRVLVVAHTERGDTMRLITARLAMLSKQRAYQEGN